MIRFRCRKCGFVLSAPIECAGLSSRCRQCSQPVTVPALTPRNPPHTDWLVALPLMVMAVILLFAVMWLFSPKFRQLVDRLIVG